MGCAKCEINVFLKGMGRVIKSLFAFVISRSLNRNMTDDVYPLMDIFIFFRN